METLRLSSLGSYPKQRIDKILSQAYIIFTTIRYHDNKYWRVYMYDMKCIATYSYVNKCVNNCECATQILAYA